MEIKKNISADLERRRTGFFLLGLILSLSVFFVAMEYTSWPAMGPTMKVCSTIWRRTLPSCLPWTPTT